MYFICLLSHKSKKYIFPMQYNFNFAPIKFKNRVNNIANLPALATKIEKAENIVLVGHVNPDGDSIGSLMGMKGFIGTTGKKVTAIVPNGYPDFLSFLDPDKEVLTYAGSPQEVEKKVGEAHLIICMDFNSLKRIDNLGDIIAGAACEKVLIDHHPGPDTIFDLIYSYPQLSSTCELVFWILEELSQMMGTNIPLSSSIALYTGMMTDTNNFSNSVLPSTFMMAGKLMEAGVDKEWVQRMVFGGYSEDRMRLMGFMLSKNMKIIPEYNAAVMVLTKEIKEKFNFTDGDSEGFVNLALNIRSVKISALFTEGDEFIRVSLRSKGDFSVNRLSRAYFNGGGHERAAGGRLFMPVAQVEEYFLKSLGDFFENEKKAHLL